MEIVEVERVFDSEPYDTWSTLIAACLHRSVGDRDRALLTPQIRGGVEAVDNLRAFDLLCAEDACHEFNRQLLDLWGRADLLLTPTLPVDPPAIGDDRPWTRSTEVFNLTRSPAGSVPVGISTAGMPVGLQIIGPQHGDVAVLGLMQTVETLSVDRSTAGQ